MIGPKRITIRNHTAEANLFARRVFIAFIGVLILLALLLVNLYDLEVTSFEKYQTRSNSNRIKLLPVEPNRGLIYDRNGVILADNRPVYSLEMIPEEVDDVENTIIEISKLLDISQERQSKLFKSLKRKRRFKPVELHPRLSDQQVALFSVNQHKFKGFFIDARLKRYYPFGELTTHSIGYVARINSRDAIKLEEKGLTDNYAATRNIGKLGLEKYYEEILHGTVGHQEVEINYQGRIIRTLSYTPPIAGKDITLTLDIELQMIAKRALANKRGAVVAINPEDGGVLAMYSNPSYDTNLFVHGISHKNYNKLSQSKDLPLINRTVQGYPPASTVKPLLALLGLEKKLITESTKVFDPGWFQLPGIERKYRDWKPQGHGWVNLTKALEQSCNVYFYILANQLGIDSISKMMEKFGFGDYTGIDIHEESRAILPSREFKRARDNKPWYGGDTISVGIGQGLWTATPLQLAQAMSILVNKGGIKVPHLLAETHTTVQSSTAKKSEGTSSDNALEKPVIIREKIQFDEKRPIVLTQPRNWDLVLDAMHNTAQKAGATAHPVFKNSHYDAAGKTGTAQLISNKQDEKYDANNVKERQRHNAMFVAFAPYEAPEIVVSVAVENVAKGGGGTNAGPVARQIMDQYFGKRVIKSADKSRHPLHTKMYN